MINKLEKRKIELEKIQGEKTQQMQILAKDISLMEQLIVKKNEFNKLVNELQKIVQEHSDICKTIEEEKQKEENS